MSYFEGSLFSLVSESNKPVNKKIIAKDISKKGSAIVGKSLTKNSFASKIRAALKPYNIKVTYKDDRFVSPNTVNANAGYDSNLEDEDYDISGLDLEIVFSPKDKKISISKNDWEIFVEIAASSIVHEYIHQSQNRKREFLPGRDLNTKEVKSAKPFKELKKRHGKKYTYDNWIAEIDYLADPDEVEAYAYNIANELLIATGDINKSRKLLKNYDKITFKQSPSMETYNKVFKKGSFVMKRLIKRVLNYLNYIPS